jgi:hypothetical protein
MTRPARDSLATAPFNVDPNRIWGRTLSTSGVVAFEAPMTPRHGSRLRPGALMPSRACWRLRPIREAV